MKPKLSKHSGVNRNYFFGNVVEEQHKPPSLPVFLWINYYQNKILTTSLFLASDSKHFCYLHICCCWQLCCKENENMRTCKTLRCKAINMMSLVVTRSAEKLFLPVRWCCWSSLISHECRLFQLNKTEFLSYLTAASWVTSLSQILLGSLLMRSRTRVLVV